MRNACTRILFAAVLVASFSLLPADLSAKGKRGATLVITRTDGTLVTGELIAAKPDSLLLLSTAGQDKSVGLGEIKSVRIVRRSHTLLLAAIGFAPGAVAGGLAMSSDPEIETWAKVAGAAVGGALGALAGLGISLGIGADATFPVAGEPGEALSRLMTRLKGLSREGRLEVAADPEGIRPAPVPRGTPTPAGVPTGVPAPSPHSSRFRLSLATTTTFGRPNRGIVRTFEAPWRFSGSIPLGESGVYSAPFFQSDYAGASAWILPGPVSLAYELTETWLPEIEVFFTPGEGRGIWGDLSFVSTTDGRTYEGRVGTNLSANFSSVLVGLNYRPIAPSRLDRTTLEVGISAGPARVKIGPEYVQATLVPADRKTVLSVRVHAAYDFFFVPAFSLGAFVDYRYLEASFAAMTGTTEAIFYGSGVEPITRQVEVSLPVLTISRSGIGAGIRIGFRF
ncbi:MAG: hypothetical protein ACXWG5_09565 [Candidatus Aminicenantales bacterium]